MHDSIHKQSPIYPPKTALYFQDERKCIQQGPLTLGRFILLENLENVKSYFFQKMHQVNILTAELPTCLEASVGSSVEPGWELTP